MNLPPSRNTHTVVPPPMLPNLLSAAELQALTSLFPCTNGTFAIDALAGATVEEFTALELAKMGAGCHLAIGAVARGAAECGQISETHWWRRGQQCWLMKIPL